MAYALQPVFSALRAYVLSRSKILGVAVLALSLAPVGANLVSVSTQTGTIVMSRPVNNMGHRFTLATTSLERSLRRSGASRQAVPLRKSILGV